MQKLYDEPKNVPPARIQSDPGVLRGKPYIRDTRLSVEFLQGLQSMGWSSARILEVYQYLEVEDLNAMGQTPQRGYGHSAETQGAASQATGLPSAATKDPAPHAK